MHNRLSLSIFNVPVCSNTDQRWPTPTSLERSGMSGKVWKYVGKGQERSKGREMSVSSVGGGFLMASTLASGMAPLSAFGEVG